MSYATWRQQILASPPLDIDNSGDFDCVDVAKHYAMYLFPGVSWVATIGYGDAKDLFAGASSSYFQKFVNNPSDPNQLPQQGDIMVFGPTPQAGYSNAYKNPYGHVGVVDTVTSTDYTLIQQDSGTGKAPWLSTRAWRYRPCIGWLRPINQTPQGGTTSMAVTTKTDLDLLYLTCLGRARGTAEGEDVYLGKDPMWVARDLYDSKEAKSRRDAAAKLVSDLQAQLAEKQREIADADDEIADLKKTVENLTAQMTERNKVVVNQQKQLDECKAQLNAVGEYEHISVKQAVRALVNAFQAWIK